MFKPPDEDDGQQPKDPPVRKTPDLESALELLRRYNKINLQLLLRRARVTSYGKTEDELVDLVRDAVRIRKLSLADLIEQLDRVEGWASQQIYLYKAPDGILDRWRKESGAAAIVKAAGHETAFNARTSLLLPAKRTLSSIVWSPERLRFVWIETRSYEEFDREEDDETGAFITRWYRKRHSRGVLAFDLDLKNGRAMMMIQALPSGTAYEKVRATLISDLTQMVDVAVFAPVKVGKAIKKIYDSGEARRRQLTTETERLTRISYTSASRKTDLKSDDAAGKSQTATGFKAGYYGNFYWPKEKGVFRFDMHVTLYAKDHRVGIFAERTEDEVRHVINRIWHYLR
jgi:hypothetical protein